MTTRTKEEIIARIPRWSTGAVRNDRLKEIITQLENLKMDEDAIRHLDAEVEAWVKHFGHEGNRPALEARRA